MCNTNKTKFKILILFITLFFYYRTKSYIFRQKLENKYSIKKIMCEIEVEIDII